MVEIGPALRWFVLGLDQPDDAGHRPSVTSSRVEDTSSTKPYDLRCTGNGAEVRVEVRGTRNDGSAVELTIGEVENARGTGWRTDLFVVSAIAVSRGDGPVSAYGGSIFIVEGWRPAVEDLSAIRFRCTVPPQKIAK
jgi:hypothetical protein